MGRFSYWMNVSVDGFVEGKPGEEGGGEWMSIDDRLHQVFNDRARLLEAGVEGRKIYEIMEDFWPGAAEDEDQDAVMREYGRIWVESRKYLVSRTRTEAEYNTTIIGGDDAIDQLAAIRRDAEGTIGVGGPTIATALLERNLLDELFLFIHPAMLGAGRPLFDRLEHPLELELLEHETFHNGVMLHRYGVLSARD